MNIKLLLFSLILWGAVSASSQSISDSILIEGSIAIRRHDSKEWITRYQDDINRYRLLNGAVTDKSCDVLFLGSSSINLWNSINSDLYPLKIIRRSYGGATIRDAIYNYEHIAQGFNPKAVAIYYENDLGNWNEAIQPGEIYDLFRLFIQMLRNDYPKAHIYIISFKPSFAKMSQLPDQLIINRLLSDYASQTPNISFIDITKTMYNADGSLRNDIFVEDRLHLNAKGYSLWTEIIKPVLLNDIKIKLQN